MLGTIWIENPLCRAKIFFEIVDTSSTPLRHPLRCISYSLAASARAEASSERRLRWKHLSEACSDQCWNDGDSRQVDEIVAHIYGICLITPFLYLCLFSVLIF